MSSETNNTTLDARERISIAIAAMGGQGGGVLGDWLISLAETNGYYAQSTSVPGVAQRTGATIYYLELFPEKVEEEIPVLALMPVPGDVDIVMAAELVEAGRAVQRGIVTPDRTTLVASNHRAYAYAEKSAMADGRIDSEALQQSLDDTAKKLICFDMQSLAENHGTVISATLFGALAGSGALPFSAEQFAAAIRGGGKAIEANLAAFEAAYELAKRAPVANETQAPSLANTDSNTASAFPAAVGEIVNTAIQRLVDYQDTRYAKTYLERLNRIHQLDSRHGGESENWALSASLAKHLALWMSYEDTIRVADLKIRESRFERSRVEVRAGEREIVHLTEFMHPRIEEVADTLPPSLGRWLLNTSMLKTWLSKTVLKERKIHTSKLSGFLTLYSLAALRKFRRRTLRYQIEQQRIKAWLERIEQSATLDYALAVEIVQCQKLVKGYSDTHARGLQNFERIMRYLDEHPQTSAETLAGLRSAALADEHGQQLNAAIAEAA